MGIFDAVIDFFKYIWNSFIVLFFSTDNFIFAIISYNNCILSFKKHTHHSILLIFSPAHPLCFFIDKIQLFCLRHNNYISSLSVSFVFLYYYSAIHLFLFIFILYLCQHYEEDTFYNPIDID